MSQRETQVRGSLQQWKGVDQRTQPTLVQDGFFVMSRGVFFGLGDNAERLPGKRLSGKLAGPVFQIWQFDKVAMVQSTTALWMISVEELSEFDIGFTPDAPPAPVLSAISFFTLNVTMPATYPIYALSFSVQRSLDNAIWSTVATGLASLQVFGDSGLTDDTLYYYRLLAVNLSTFTAGPSTSGTTLERLPDAPAAPTYINIVADGYDVVLPVLPLYTVSLNLQSAPDGVTWTTIATGIAPGASHNITGLAPATTRHYRAVAVNVHGSTNGTASDITTGAALGDFRLTELGDTRITESGDFRIIE